MISSLLALNAKCFYWSILSLEVLNEIYAKALVLTFMCHLQSPWQHQLLLLNLRVSVKNVSWFKFFFKHLRWRKEKSESKDVE